MKQSMFGSLNLRDLVNGFVVAFLAAALTGVITSLDSGHLPTVSEIKAFGIVGLTAGLSYVLKNVLTNSSGELLKKESK